MAVDKSSRDIPVEIVKMSFEEAYNALKDATERLEGEEVNLDETLEAYARASNLARHCANLLDEAEERVRILIESEGVMELTSLDEEE